MNDISLHDLSLKPGLQYLHLPGVQLAIDYQCAVDHPLHLFILVNGYQRTRLDFRAFRKKFEKYVPHVATVVLDNRGCGETIVTDKKELSMEIMAKDVHNVATIFMEKLNLKTFSLLGVSMGGMIVQTLAGLFPLAPVHNLFLVSTTAGGAGRFWPRFVADPKKLKYENRHTDLESTRKNMSRYFADKFLENSPLLFETMCKNILKTAGDEKQNIKAAEQYYLAAQFDGTPFLSKISAKKIIIFSGDEDKIIPAQNSVYLNQHINRSQLILYPQVGHLILIEEPEKFVRDTVQFF